MKRSVVTGFVVVILSSILAGTLEAQPPQGGQGPGGRRGGFGGFGGFGGPPGPAAPVPPEVAIVRPSAEEVAKMNDELKKLVDGDTSPIKPLFEKYKSLVQINAPRPNPAATYTQSGVRGPRHDAFVERAKQGDIDILFEGDSITDWWSQSGAQGGAEALQKYFGDKKVANFAVAGDTTQGVLWGLQNGEGQNFQPKAIMLMIGTNNTGSNTGPEIAEGVGAVVMELRKDFPEAKILLLAIFPRGAGPNDASRQKNDEANKIIPKLADNKHVFFMDLGPKFLDDKGVLIPGAFRNDNLHPAAKGYEIWGEAVKDTLDGFLKS
jgi:lysophospholipase L1-like esterase